MLLELWVGMSTPCLPFLGSLGCLGFRHPSLGWEWDALSRTPFTWHGVLWPFQNRQMIVQVLGPERVYLEQKAKPTMVEVNGRNGRSQGCCCFFSLIIPCRFPHIIFKKNNKKTWYTLFFSPEFLKIYFIFGNIRKEVEFGLWGLPCTEYQWRHGMTSVLLFMKGHNGRLRYTQDNPFSPCLLQITLILF